MSPTNSLDNAFIGTPLFIYNYHAQCQVTTCTNNAYDLNHSHPQQSIQSPLSCGSRQGHAGRAHSHQDRNASP